MSTFTKLDNGRVIYEDDDGEKTGFSSSLSVVPHPEMPSIIVLTSTGSKQSQMLTGFNFDWNKVATPLATNRSNLIELLNLNYFNDSVAITMNGQVPGTFFGDDIKTTRKVPVLATKYNQGLPTFAIDSDIVGSGYWEIPEIGGVKNGVSELGTGIDSDGKVFISSTTLNRYEPGQVSYYIFTASFDGIDEANGNFELLIGSVLRGTVTEGKFGDIKEGFVFGFIKDSSADPRRVFRVYKNYVVVLESLISDEKFNLVKENLHIFHLNIGYLGINPVELKFADVLNRNVKTIHYQKFEQNTTNTNNPNQAIGVFLENKGNTTNITLRNGSVQFGNYAERQQTDASSRSLIDKFEVASIIAGTDIVLAAYTVPEFVNMVKRHDLGGDTLDTFRNTLGNRLLNVQATAIPQSNKVITYNFYFIPKADIDATFTDLRPGVNILQRALAAAIVSVSLTNADQIGSFIIPTEGVNENVILKNLILTSDTVAVLTITSTQSSTDFSTILDTEDLF